MKLNSDEKYYLLTLIHQYHQAFDKSPNDIDTIIKAVEDICRRKGRELIENMSKKTAANLLSNLKKELLIELN